MASNKRRLLKRRRSSEEELWEILNQPCRDPEHKVMRAWLKREKQYGRIYPGDSYLEWLEQKFGPIDNAEDFWLTPLPSPK